MAYVKGVNRSASAAFAPDGGYLAAGTMAGAVDLQFSSSANLDIFELDFVSDDRQLYLAGTAPSPDRFNRLSWGRGSPSSQDYSLGLIAGGLVDGNIGLWNPKFLIRSTKSSDSSENAFVANLARHRGPVRGLEFNSITPNLIASGADEGDITIWDVSKPSEPTHFPPLKASGSGTQVEISFLSWNNKVQHILASTSYNGTTVVWDLKRQKQVISFSDSNRRRCSVLQWHPDVATQLIVASDDDASPSLKLWDMRNTMTPVREFSGHTKGVIAMSWCPIDSSYLLTCAKDNRTICWDTLTGEIAVELPAGANWNFDVHWYSKVPGLISASSFDGKIGIYNIEGCGRHGFGETDFSPAPLRAPKWYKRKVGVSFGFGGKLVSFSEGSPEVHVQGIVTEHGLVSRSSAFEAAIQNGDRTALKHFCEQKSQESESEEERETWSFMKVMFTEDGNPVSKLLSHLGFSPPAEESNAILNDVSEQVNALSLDETATKKEGFSRSKEPELAIDNGEDFFNNLPSPKADTPLSSSKNDLVAGDPVNGSHPEVIEQQESSDPSFDDAVQRALVVGDYKGAVAQCISANRLADALVIANVGGASLWERTRDQYLKMSHSPYLKVVSAMVNSDLMGVVNTRPLKSWKETLAFVSTFAQKDEWVPLCDTLAARLFAAGESTAATLCYICTRNIDKAVEMWSKSLTEEVHGKPCVDRLQDLMEKTLVFILATGQKQFSASVCKLVEKYAEILASQGNLSTAMEYLNFLGTEEISLELKILRDRIALSTQPDTEMEKPQIYDNTQMPNEPAYVPEQSGYRVDPPEPYYQPPMQPSVLSSPYNDYNQRQAVQDGRSTSYQSVPQNYPQQPTMFVPSPAKPAPMVNIPLPVNTQPATKFVPAEPPLLKNVERYHPQPSSLGAQLYPVTSNPSYQPGPPGYPAYGVNPTLVGPPPLQNMSQVLNPTPPSRGFMPVSNPGVQRPGMNSMQSDSPSQPAQVQQPVPVSAPPPTVQTADISNVPAHQKPVVATLTRLYNEITEALGGERANPAKKREIDDNSRKLGALFAKLNSGDISKNAAEKLVQLCQAVDNGDFATATHIHVLLTANDWDECSFWLSPLKRMLKMRQNLR